MPSENNAQTTAVVEQELTAEPVAVEAVTAEVSEEPVSAAAVEEAAMTPEEALRLVSKLQELGLMPQTRQQISAAEQEELRVSRKADLATFVAEFIGNARPLVPAGMVFSLRIQPRHPTAPLQWDLLLDHNNPTATTKPKATGEPKHLIAGKAYQNAKAACEDLGIVPEIRPYTKAGVTRVHKDWSGALRAWQAQQTAAASG